MCWGERGVRTGKQHVLQVLIRVCHYELEVERLDEHKLLLVERSLIEPSDTAHRLRARGAHQTGRPRSHLYVSDSGRSLQALCGGWRAENGWLGRGMRADASSQQLETHQESRTAWTACTIDLAVTALSSTCQPARQGREPAPEHLTSASKQ